MQNDLEYQEDDSAIIRKIGTAQPNNARIYLEESVRIIVNPPFEYKRENFLRLPLACQGCKTVDICSLLLEKRIRI